MDIKRAAAAEFSAFLARFTGEWMAMRKDPVFLAYGGDASDAERDRYIDRRCCEIRRNLTAYLNHPECLALAELFDERATARYLAR